MEVMSICKLTKIQSLSINGVCNFLLNIIFDGLIHRPLFED